MVSREARAAQRSARTAAIDALSVHLIVAGQQFPGLYRCQYDRRSVSCASTAACRAAVRFRDRHRRPEILPAEPDHSLLLDELLEAKAGHTDRFARSCRQSFIDRFTDLAANPTRIAPPEYDAFFDGMSCRRFVWVVLELNPEGSWKALGTTGARRTTI